MKRQAKTAKIFNKEYNIKTPLSDEEFESIVNMLNKRIKEMEKQAGTADTQKLAILTALHTTADNYFIQKKIDSLISKVSEVF